MDPIGIVNSGNNCWLISLFQCIAFSQHYKSILLKYLDDDHIWKLFLTKYIRHVENSTSNEPSRRVFSKKTFDIQLLRSTWFDHENSQQDVRQAFEMLMDVLPDRKPTHCARCALKDMKPIDFIKYYEAKRCEQCQTSRATYGYECDKSIMGRVVQILRPRSESESISNESFTKQMTSEADDLQKYTKASYTPYGNIPYRYSLEEVVVIGLKMPRSVEPIDIDTMLSDWTNQVVSDTEIESWKGIDRNENITCFDIIQTQSELFCNRVTSELPHEIVLGLHRFYWDKTAKRQMKINDMIKINLKEINLRKLFSIHHPNTQNMSNSDFIYQVFAFIVHQGGANSGHYYAYVETKPGLWFCCNDHIVRAVDINLVQNEIQNAYLLFLRLSSQQIRGG